MNRRDPTVKILCLLTLLRNKDIKVRFMLNGKPIGNAPVSSWSPPKRTIAGGQGLKRLACY